MRSALNSSEICAALDGCLEVEFTFLHTEEVAAQLSRLPVDTQLFVLRWVRRVASTNIQLAYQFALRAEQALRGADEAMLEAWCLHAMDAYDRNGLRAAMAVMQDLDGFLVYGHQRAAASLFDEARAVLLPFVQGLSGRQLAIELGDAAWTDGEVLYLPELIARLPSEEENFQLYKVTVVHLWAQTRYGTFGIDLVEQFAAYPDPKRAERLFHRLEVLRLDGCIARELPGLRRRALQLGNDLGDAPLPDEWRPAEMALQRPGSTVQDSLAWLGRLYAGVLPDALCYQGELRPEAAWAARLLRLQREEARFREVLRVIAEEIAEGRDGILPEAFELDVRQSPEQDELPEMTLLLADQPLPVPDHVKGLMRSIVLDLGEIPEEYLVPAGEGEYDPVLLGQAAVDLDAVWSGTYHEEGADFYDEWDHGRQHYRRNWCVMREHEGRSGDLGFYRETLARYRGLIRSLHRTFEVLRGEDRLLRRQPQGEDVDIDAFVEAWGDVHHGLEMNDRLFVRLHRDDRNIAVMFMVDMSGSTKGWINQAEREALILLVEALEVLGDRYAIYGFSGWARKRCETYRIKTFDEPLDDGVKERICGIEAKDYTRMGPAIRHLTRLFKGVEARTKLLITLSDGKPDDYDHEYRGVYGIEDTRRALFEARMAGVHAYCITIDKEGRDYLPHMYGAANYIVLDDVAKLPLKVSDIYRKITT